MFCGFVVAVVAVDLASVVEVAFGDIAADDVVTAVLLVDTLLEVDAAAAAVKDSSVVDLVVDADEVDVDEVEAV